MPDKITDQVYLKEQQYKTPKNLQSRIALHRDFSTNPYPWQKWVYDQLEMSGTESVLEIGCGPANLWAENLGRSERPFQLFLSDLSTGMLQVASSRFPKSSMIHFLAADAQAFPFPSDSFNLVVANHMLYHVPDIQQSLAEIARVLKPDGRLAAATNGTKHMHQLHTLLSELQPGYQSSALTRRFSLENAPGMLAEHFSHVELKEYHSHLHVTDGEALMRYIQSMWLVDPATSAAIYEKARQRIDNQIKSHGYMQIDKSMGLFMCQLSG